MELSMVPFGDRFYRFSEFGRELVYDIEGVSASFLNEVEAKLLDSIQEGKTVEESTRLLQAVYSYDPAAIAAGLQRLEDLACETPYQELSPKYALTLNVTQACNLRCKYCYVDKSSAATDFMSQEVAQKAVDFVLGFQDLQVLGVAFYGGEPLLNFPVIKSTIEYVDQAIRRRGLPEVEYHLTTNGTLLTDEVLAFLRDHQVNVLVSIDGPASIHDEVRVTPTGEGTHAVVSDCLQRLMQVSGHHKVSASSVVTNRGRLRDAYQYLAQFPLEDIKISYVRYIGRGEYSLTEADKAQYVEDMKALARECADLLLQGIRPPYYNFESKILQLWARSKRRYFCPAGMKRFGVSPRGGVYPCGPAAAMDTWQLGTLEGGLSQAAMDSWREIVTFDRRENCQACWARYLCAGGCPLQLVRSFDEGGCEINQLATQLAIAIYALVKESNETMLAALVDKDFMAHIKYLLQHAKA
jgi:uncharacterized protein